MELKWFLLFLFFINILMSLLLFISTRGKNIYPGFKHFALSNLFVGSGYLLYALQGEISDVATVIVAGGIFVFVSLLRVTGVRKFYEIKTTDRIYILLVPAIFLTAYFLYRNDSAVIRNIIIMVMMAGAAGYIGFIIIKNRSDREEGMNFFYAAVFFIFGIVAVTRAASMVIEPYKPFLIDLSVIGIAYFLFALLTDVLPATMFLVMHIYRINRELEMKSVQTEEMGKVKEKLFAIIAHDLRNPFHGIIGYSNILINELRERKEDEIAYRIETIKESAEHANQLLENSLKWVKTQLGSIKPRPERINLFELLETAQSYVDVQAGIKHVTLGINVEKNIYITADREMMETVLRNIFQNAIKFSFEGGDVRVNIHSNKDGIVISIDDNGIGMEKDEIASIFEEGTIVTKKGTRDEMGTGLGLFLCREYISKNNGEIWVESKPREGSSFKILLRKFEVVQE